MNEDDSACQGQWAPDPTRPETSADIGISFIFAVSMLSREDATNDNARFMKERYQSNAVAAQVSEDGRVVLVGGL